MPSAPSIRIVTPKGGLWPDVVPVDYVLVDSEADLVDVEVSFSLDGGTTFTPATEVQPSDGVRALASSPAGVPHRFTWNAGADLGATAAIGVRLRVRGTDPTGTGEAVSPGFDVGALVPTPVPVPTSFTPEVALFPPIDDVGSPAPIKILVGDREGGRLDLRIEWQPTGGGVFQRCTPAPTSDHMTGLASPTSPADYRFEWDVAADGASGPVTVRVTPVRGGVSSSARTASFSVSTGTRPVAPPPTVPVPVVPVLTIVDGDGQTGIAGMLLGKPLKVRVDGPHGPLGGVRVSFAAEPGSLEVELEEPSVSTKDDGTAEVRLRPKSGTVGPGRVTVRVAGTRSTPAVFGFQVSAPVLTYDSVAPQHHFGILYSVDVGLDGEHAPDPRRSLRLAVVGSNVVTMVTSVCIPDARGATRVRILYTPSIPGPIPDATTTSVTPANASITVTHPDPAVAPLTIPIGIATPATSRRPRVGGADDVRLRLQPLSGIGPVGAPQIGCAGRTLLLPLKVEIIDDANQRYTERITGNNHGCDVEPQGVPARVTYRAQTGTLSTNQAPGTFNVLTAELDTEVYFTPSGPGPWSVRAEVTEDVVDPRRVRVPSVDAHGNPSCYRQNYLDLRAHRGAYFLFVFRAPEPQWVDAADPAKVKTELRAGDRARLRLVVSPTVAGDAEPFRVEALNAEGEELPIVNGQAHPFVQTDIALLPTSPSVIDSAPVQFLQGDPTLPTAPLGTVLGLLPGGQVLASGPVHLATPAAGRRARRKLVDGVESLQENLTGSTPRGGADSTVSLASGELTYSACDLEVHVLDDCLTFMRCYRSHALGDGPLGPGWSFEPAPFLDLARWSPRVWPLPLSLSDGVLFELRGPFTRGLPLRLTVRSTIDDNQSVFELADAQKTVLHFNVDGSPRFLVDRRDRKTRYRYDVHGRLSEVIDSLDRNTTFAYFDEHDAPAPEAVGKLKRLTHGGRSVEYEYYGPDNDDGPPGWLKCVRSPEAPTRTGADEPTRRRSESYVYQFDKDRPEGALLIKIIDDHDRARITTRYDAAARVEEQDHGRGTWRFAYDTSVGKTTMTDRLGNKSEYLFPSSPFLDAAAPVTVTRLSNRNVRTGEGDHAYGLLHDGDGRLLWLSYPGGSEASFRYNETATDVLRRGDLLAAREHAGGAVRVWSFEYHRDWPFVVRMVGPDGHVPGVNSNCHATTCDYDSKGNLVRTRLPRALHAVVVPTATARRTVWIDEFPTFELAYNDHGQVKRTVDAQGVATEYRYHSRTSPIAGALSPEGGGQMAEVERDVNGGLDGTADSPRRATFLPGVPAQPRKTSWSYDAAGEIREIEDALGVVTTYHVNALGEVNRIVEADRTPGDPPALRIASNFSYDGNGVLVRSELEQPGASTEAGGASLVESYAVDTIGNVVACERTAGGGSQVREVYLLDANDMVEGFRPVSAESGSAAFSGLRLVEDERGLPARLLEGADTTPGASTFAALRTTGIAFDSDGVLTGMTARGANLELRVDERRSPDAVIDADGTVLRIVHDAAGRPTRSVTFLGDDPADGVLPDAPVGAFTEQRYDELGRLRREHVGAFVPRGSGSVTAPLRVIGDVPDAQPELGDLLPSVHDLAWPPRASTEIVDQGWGPNDGRATTDYAYDAWDLWTRIVDDAGGVLRVRRNGHGEPMEADSSSGDVARYTHDAAGQLTEVAVTHRTTDPQFPGTRTFRVRYDHDALGRVVRTVDGAGNAVYAAFDQVGHMRSRWDAMGGDSSEDYLGTAINLAGNETRFDRDGIGRIVRIETALRENGRPGPTPEANPFNAAAKVGVTIEYEPGGELKAIVDQHGDRSTWEYDEFGRIWAVRPAGSGAGTRTTYYPDGGPIQIIRDPNGSALELSYDDALRVIEVRATAKGTGVIGTTGYSSAYVADVVEHTDLTTGRSIGWRMDSLGRVGEQAQGSRRVFSDFDGAGRRRAVALGVGIQVVRYAHDPAGRLISVEWDGQALARFVHLGNHGRLAQVQRGITTSFTYGDRDGRLIGMRTDGIAGSTIVWELERDRTGRLTRCARTAGGATETRRWSYDSASRITQEICETPAGTVTTSRLFDGDGVVRRLTFAGALGTQIFGRDRGALGRISAVDGTALGYDANGNLTSEGQHSYAYDVWNRLVSVHRAGQLVVTFEYDALHRRIAAVHDGEREEYLYDGSQLVEVSVAGAPRERYVYGEDLDDLLAVELEGQRYSVLLSPEGHVDSLVDEQQGIVESYRYSLDGAVTVVDAARRPTGTPPRCRLLFQRHMWDERARLYDFRMRWYHPTLGQFLTPDPAGFCEGPNLYAFCHGDPVNLRDDNGEQAVAAGATTLSSQPHHNVHPGYPYRAFLQGLLGVFEPITKPVSWNLPHGAPYRTCRFADPIYNLWSSTAGRRWAKRAPGYLMEQTLEHMKANRIRREGMIRNGYTRARFREALWNRFRRKCDRVGSQICNELHKQAWIGTNRSAVWRAVMSGHGVRSFGLDAHKAPLKSFQYEHELRGLRRASRAAGTLSGGSGLLTIYAAQRVDNPLVRWAAYGLGGAEVVAGGMYARRGLQIAHNAWQMAHGRITPQAYRAFQKTASQSMRFWGKLANRAGAAATVVLSAYFLYDDYQRGDVVGGIGDGLFLIAGASGSPLAWSAAAGWTAGTLVNDYALTGGQKTFIGDTMVEVFDSPSYFTWKNFRDSYSSLWSSITH